MRLLNSTNAPAIFVGDGLSDRYAAARADLVFAKGDLAAYCDQQTISYTPYQSLAAIAKRLEHLLHEEAPPRI